MSRPEREFTPPELLPIVERLQHEKPRASAVELDRAKLRAISRASSGRSRRQIGSTSGPLLRSRRLANLAVAVALVGGAMGVIAASGTGPFHEASTEFDAASSQYCPPTSQRPGEPKKPHPQNCGNPQTKK
jgi:hypothetical protein